MQFMASISLDTTPIRRRTGGPRREMRVREFQQQGVLDALYVPDGSGAPDGLWVVFNGESRDAVQRVIESLPLHPYMQLELTPALAAAGPRAIAPDLVGFGRSDKLTSRLDYTYQRHVDWMHVDWSRPGIDGAARRAHAA